MVENDKEYRKFLNEIQQKVDDRPLLIDQHDEVGFHLKLN